MAAKIVFVTGTDTECGKTYTSLALMQAMQDQGAKVLGYKPVAAGCKWIDGRWRNEDALALQAQASERLDYEAVNPIALEPPIAPHLAAEMADLSIDTDHLAEGARALAQRCDVLIIEGAGGFLVPLNNATSFADLVTQQAWPVVLVVGMRLGCLNHALLSAEAIVGRQLPLLGWVANCLPPLQPRIDENIESLMRRIDAPCLGRLPAGGGLEQAAGSLDIDVLKAAGLI